MKKRPFLLLLFFSLLSGIRLHAQSTFGMSTQIQTITDTVSWNYIDTFNVWVKNYGPNSFNGNIKVFIAADSGTGPKIFKIDSITLFGLTNFQKNDSLQVQVFYTYTPSNNFKPGGNTIVIWPQRSSGSTASTLDSLKHNVFIDTKAGTHDEEKGEGLFHLFPNPTHNTTVIYPSTNTKGILEYRLYGITGSLVAIFPPNTSVINLEEYRCGVYLFEITARDGHKQVIRVIRH